MRPTLLDLVIGGVTVVLSTLSVLLGSAPLTLLSLVGGCVSFGISLGRKDE